ncbi:MAG TPA: hypothetical protein VM784_08525 [Actinomycetota bacterium]|nr:hypothetical protein [Actinomycetota bacterium]
MTEPPGEDVGGDLIRLPDDRVAPRPAAPPPARHGGSHGFVVTLMAAFAVIGICAMFAFITVKWPGETSRYVIAVFVFSVVGFISCASIAVFTAARGMVASSTARDGNHPRSAS